MATKNPKAPGRVTLQPSFVLGGQYPITGNYVNLGGVNMLKNYELASTYRPIPSQDAIKRRFNGVLARFTILSILFELRAALGLGLLGGEPPRRN